MTEERLVVAELLEKAGDGDFLRAVAEAVLQLLMETDVEGMIGAGRYERSGERTTWRNGYRERTLDTRLGALQLRIPKLRQGSYFPPFLEARKSSEKALIAVIQACRRDRQDCVDSRLTGLTSPARSHPTARDHLSCLHPPAGIRIDTRSRHR
jgi:transposase-like protein